MVPFKTFAIATLLGKAFIKAFIQCAFVVLLFSRDYSEQIVRLFYSYLPRWAHSIQEWILTQRAVFQERKPDPTVGAFFVILTPFILWL